MVSRLRDIRQPTEEPLTLSSTIPSVTSPLLRISRSALRLARSASVKMPASGWAGATSIHWRKRTPEG